MSEADNSPSNEPELPSESLSSELELNYPRQVSFNRGIGWIIEGAEFFKKSLGAWMLTTLVGFAILIFGSAIPVIGQAFIGLTYYIWVSGLMLGCKAQYEGKPFEVRFLFDGFKQEQIFKLVILAIVANFVNVGLTYLLVGDFYSQIAEAKQQSPEELQKFMSTPEFRSHIFWVVLGTIPILMATLFAPALIVLHKISILKALQYSFIGCAKNIIPLLIYSVVLLAFLMLAIIPMFLGLLFYFPVAYASVFSAYKDIFTQPHTVNDHMIV